MNKYDKALDYIKASLNIDENNPTIREHFEQIIKAKAELEYSENKGQKKIKSKIFYLLLISLFLGCINTDLSKRLKSIKIKVMSQLLKNKSFKGSGTIQIGVKSSKRIPFSYITKNDSSLIYIRDLFGRSIFLIGISKNNILLKDLRKNKMIDKKNLNINWVIFRMNTSVF